MKIRITNPIINSIYEVGQILTVKEKHDDGVFVLEGEQGVYNQEFEIVEEMTPQQKLERLIELAKEAQEIMSSMNSNDAMHVVSLSVSGEKSQILMSDENDFLTLFPDCHVRNIESTHFTRCLTHQRENVEFTTYAGEKS